jgi:hypothetical protein
MAVSSVLATYFTSRGSVPFSLCIVFAFTSAYFIATAFPRLRRFFMLKTSGIMFSTFYISFINLIIQLTFTNLLLAFMCWTPSQYRCREFRNYDYVHHHPDRFCLSWIITILHKAACNRNVDYRNSWQLNINYHFCDFNCIKFVIQ